MKDISELNDLMADLIDNIGEDISTISDEDKATISDIAEYARSTKAYKRAQNKTLECEHTSAAVYDHLLLTVASAPTDMHVKIACLVIMPVLDDCLKEGV